MNWLIELLFGWWWYGQDGRTKTANAADPYLVPLAVAGAIVCLIGLLVWASR